jgi:uncharacterized protein
MTIVDTGFLVALLHDQDMHHAKAITFVDIDTEQWVTTWPVITEAYYLLQKKMGTDAAQILVQEIENGGLHIWEMPLAQLPHMRKLLSKYKQLPMDLADASLVLLAEHLGHGRILTTDQRDFGAYRWKSRKPFTDLMAAK